MCYTQLQSLVNIKCMNVYLGMKSDASKEQAKRPPGNTTMRSMNCLVHTTTIQWICQIWTKATS